MEPILNIQFGVLPSYMLSEFYTLSIQFQRNKTLEVQTPSLLSSESQVLAL